MSKEGEKLLREIELKNVEKMIPSNWDIYTWAREHPKTTIAHSLKRIEKIMDLSDDVYSAKSGGKDSTVSAELLCLELSLRKMRVEAGVDRDGNKRIDPLDAKWYNKKVEMMQTDAEVVFSDTNNYTKRFLEKMGPEGFDLLQFNWMAYEVAWQNGASYADGVLISWDDNLKENWVQPMPTREDLHGFDVLSRYNQRTSNAVPLGTLTEEAQKYHRDNGNVEIMKGKDLAPSSGFAGKFEPDEDVEVVANYGRGPIEFVVKGMHEKELQDAYSYFWGNTSWLKDTRQDANFYVSRDKIDEEIRKRYKDGKLLEKDVWRLTPAGDSEEHLRVSSALVSLRAEESLDRRVILRQGEYSTGQYSNNQGVNVCSPVFDYSTEDIWRVLSATDWDVNDVYEKLYEIGVGIGDQRVGSLLNYAAVRQISTVKALEPDLYGRINARFQNVEFISQFSRSGYFRIGKPKDASWNGHNHLKAGKSEEELKELSDKYEDLLKELEIPYIRNGNEFGKPNRTKDDIEPWRPLKEYIKNVEKNSKENSEGDKE